MHIPRALSVVQSFSSQLPLPHLRSGFWDSLELLVEQQDIFKPIPFEIEQFFP